jgi:hypothetical protein
MERAVAGTDKGRVFSFYLDEKGRSPNSSHGRARFQEKAILLAGARGDEFVKYSGKSAPFEANTLTRRIEGEPGGGFFLQAKDVSLSENDVRHGCGSGGHNVSGPHPQAELRGLSIDCHVPFEIVEPTFGYLLGLRVHPLV